MGSGAQVSQSIPVSQQAPWDVGVSAQAAPAPGSAVTLSPPAGRWFGMLWDANPCAGICQKTATVRQAGFSQLSHQQEPPSDAVVML